MKRDLVNQPRPGTLLKYSKVERLLHGGFTLKDACEKVGMMPSTFREMKVWMEAQTVVAQQQLKFWIDLNEESSRVERD